MEYMEGCLAFLIDTRCAFTTCQTKFRVAPCEAKPGRCRNPIPQSWLQLIIDPCSSTIATDESTAFNPLMFYTDQVYSFAEYESFGI